MTTALTPRSREAIQEIVALESVNKTDAVNRALIVYAYLLKRGESSDLLLRNQQTGEVETLRFL
ncbi:hypothetical protein [Kitasatospora sp. LaBMicrA B282]|uniref:hypothetical protein n=1 Tax=Kitasatospora sp. LaBMicrA B282 TaxID=3420949 RepID=UPI003D0F9794